MQQIWYVPSVGVSQGSVGAAGVEALTEVCVVKALGVTSSSCWFGLFFLRLLEVCSSDLGVEGCPRCSGVWSTGLMLCGLRQVTCVLRVASVGVRAPRAWCGCGKMPGWRAVCLCRDRPEEPSQRCHSLLRWLTVSSLLLKILTRTLRKIMFGKIQFVSLKG